MFPYKSIIHIDKSSKTALYLQICNTFIKRIQDGTLTPGQKLPGSRLLAEWLSVNRRTVISAYEEMQAQGWVEIRPNSGCFVSTKLPMLQKRGLHEPAFSDSRVQSHFLLEDNMPFLEYYDPPPSSQIQWVIDAGYPDVRLSPLKELSRNLNSLMRRNKHARLMNYSGNFNGDIKLRKEIIKYLAETRSINIELENMFVSRGSLMAFFLIFQVLLQPDDVVIVGDVSFKVANNIIRITGGKIVEVPIDEKGMNIDEIENICKRQQVRAVFVMPHHHNPTTVSLTAERRMKLLMLAREYQFAIIEDDYDYDFHYASSPLLPMASSDTAGSVIYVGSLSKTIAPGLRMGYIVGPQNLIADISRLSRFIDCHGNTALERAIAILYEDGEIKRYLKKALSVYRERRNSFCQLLKEELGEWISFKIPEGGMAVWVEFDKAVCVNKLRNEAINRGLQIPKALFRDLNGRPLNAIRMGFASLDQSEMREAIAILKKALITIL